MVRLWQEEQKDADSIPTRSIRLIKPSTPWNEYKMKSSTDGRLTVCQTVKFDSCSIVQLLIVCYYCIVQSYSAAVSLTQWTISIRLDKKPPRFFLDFQ